VTEPSAQLDYAPPPPMHRRRSFRRALIAGAALCLVFGGFMWGPRTWRRVELLLLQRQCMAYTRPPTQVVYEPDRVRGAALWVVGGEYVKRPPGGVLHQPPIAARAGLGDGFFLHGRHRPDGRLRLVNVTLWYTASGGVDLGANVHTPMTFTQPSTARTSSTDFPRGPTATPPRLYAGQPNPNDPTRFTIRYEYSDESGVVHGRLNDDDTITFQWTADTSAPTSAPGTPPRTRR
jgi:hypothetical protein